METDIDCERREKGRRILVEQTQDLRLWTILERGLLFVWPYGNIRIAAVLQCPCSVMLILFLLCVKCLRAY